MTVIWYTRLGHIRAEKITRLVRGGLLGPLALVTLPTCERYFTGKLTRKLFGKAKCASTLLNLFHSDIYRPFNVKAQDGCSYYITFIDNFVIRSCLSDLPQV